MAKKQTFTYATSPDVRLKAMKKAKRENLTLSEKIDQMLRAYVKPKPKEVPINRDLKQATYYPHINIL